MLASTGEFDFLRNGEKLEKCEDQEIKHLINPKKGEKNNHFSEKKLRVFLT
jgi:hypothetical protein